MSCDKIPSPFGRLVRDLRGHERRKDFAGRLTIGESTIGSVESGERTNSLKLLKRLVVAFPEREKEIIDAFGESTQPHSPRSRLPAETPMRQQIRAQIEIGRMVEARRALLLQLTLVSDIGEHFWLYEQLARVNFSLDKPKEGHEAMIAAINAGQHASPADPKLVTLRDQLASRLQRLDEFTAAHTVLDDGLLVDPTASTLWRRKGVVHWYEHRYAEAYAALMTAVKHGHPLSRILHARGSVLAEWGNYTDALRDLNEVVEHLDLPPISRAYARSTRAHVFAKLAKHDLALAEFQKAEEVTPRNAWLYYFRALCYSDMREDAQVTQNLERAMDCNEPSLNCPKRVVAQEMLNDGEADTRGEH